MVKWEVGSTPLVGMARVRLRRCKSCWLITGTREWWKRSGAIRKASLNGLLNGTRTHSRMSVQLVYRNIGKLSAEAEGLGN